MAGPARDRHPCTGPQAAQPPAGGYDESTKAAEQGNPERAEDARRRRWRAAPPSHGGSGGVPRPPAAMGVEGVWGRRGYIPWRPGAGSGSSLAGLCGGWWVLPLGPPPTTRGGADPGGGRAQDPRRSRGTAAGARGGGT